VPLQPYHTVSIAEKRWPSWETLMPTDPQHLVLLLLLSLLPQEPAGHTPRQSALGSHANEPHGCPAA